MTTVVVAALPRELAAFTRGWQQCAAPAGVSLFRSGQLAAVTAGIGPERVTLAVGTALNELNAERLLSVGLAGACDPSLHVGDVVHAHHVVDVRSGEHFTQPGDTSASPEAVLATSPTIASVPEKRRLFESYSAALVDMEAATVARLARARGLHFAAIKAVSDDATFAMEELGRFVSDDGQFREAAFAAWVALRPRRWAHAAALGRHSAQALKALTAHLQQELSPQQPLPKTS